MFFAFVVSLFAFMRFAFGITDAEAYHEGSLAGTNMVGASPLGQALLESLRGAVADDDSGGGGGGSSDDDAEKVFGGVAGMNVLGHGLTKRDEGLPRKPVPGTKTYQDMVNEQRDRTRRSCSPGKVSCTLKEYKQSFTNNKFTADAFLLSCDDARPFVDPDPCHCVVAEPCQCVKFTHWHGCEYCEYAIGKRPCVGGIDYEGGADDLLKLMPTLLADMEEVHMEQHNFKNQSKRDELAELKATNVLESGEFTYVDLTEGNGTNINILESMRAFDNYVVEKYKEWYKMGYDQKLNAADNAALKVPDAADLPPLMPF